MRHHHNITARRIYKRVLASINKVYLRRTILLICIISILFSNTLTVYAENYSRSENDYNIQENEPLSEEEIDNLLDSENNNDDNDSSDEYHDNREKELNNLSDGNETKKPPLLGLLFNSPETSEPLNNIDVKPSFSSSIDGIYIVGTIELSSNDYEFDHLDIKRIDEDSIIESISSLDEENRFESSLISFELDAKYQYEVITYYSKCLVNEEGEPIIDDETSQQKIDTISFSSNTDEFIITKLDRPYPSNKLAKIYGVKHESLVDDNNIETILIPSDTAIFLRNPKEKYEPIEFNESDLDLLSAIGYIESNAYIDDTNIATGNYFYSYNDLFINEYDGISIDRYYNTFNALNDNYFANFTSSLDVKLVSVFDYYVLVLSDGRAIKLEGSDSIYNSLDGKYTLTVDSDTYKATHNEIDKESYTFNKYLEYETYSNKYGIIYSLIYEDHVLSKLITKANKELTFDLDNHYHVVKINLPNDSSITYEYSNDKLISVTDQNNYKIIYEYNDNLLVNVCNNNLELLLSLTYDDNKVSTIKHGEANEGYFSYDSSSLITTYKNPNNYEFKYQYNSSNELIKLIYPDNSIEEYFYDDKGNITKYINRVNQATLYTYDSNSNITKITDSNDVETYYTYDSNNNILSYKDEEGYITSYNYDSNNNLLSTIFDDGTTINYSYDSNNRLLSTADEKGNKTTYEYGEYLDKPITEIDPNNNAITYSYDSLGNNLTITIDSKTTTLEYDSKSNLIKSTSSDNKSNSLTYDQFNNLTSKTDENNNTTTYKYDLNNNLIEENKPSGAITYTYDSLGNVLSKTDPLGNTYKYEYDFDNNLIKTINPENIISGNTYDKKGNILSTTDKRGFVEYFEYHPTLNKLTKHTDKLGRIYLYEYDDKGNKTKEVLPDGVTLEYTYDSKDRVLSSTTEQGLTIYYTYDDAGNLIKKENSLGNFESYEYDKNKNIIKEIDVLGNETTYTYDSANRLSTKTLPNELKTTYSYDEVGNLIQENTNGHITKYTYSGNNLTSKTDPNSNKVTYTYDSSNRPTKETYKDGSINSVVYDSNGNVIKRIDPYGNITQYEFDSLGNNTKVIDPKGNITLYEYDPEGNNTKITYPNGKTVYYEYNALSWLTKTTESTGLVSDITYDTMGRITSVISNNGVKEYSTYDIYGNLIETKDQAGNAITCTYSQRGLLLSSSSYTGETHEYAYDALERLISTKDNKGIITTYEYDSNSNLIKTTDSLGHQTINTLDLFGNIKESTDSLGITTKYDYDGNNNISKITYPDDTFELFTYDYLNRQVSHTDPNGNTSTCKYDLNGNLLESTTASGIITIYEYDELNNLKAKKEGPFITTYEYDSMSNNTKITDPYGTETTFIYDLDSNLKSTKNAYNAVTTYDYDSRNNLIRTTYDNGIFEEKSYDDLNRIISSKDVYGLITIYEYDSRNNLIKTYNDLGQEESFEYDEYNRVIKNTVKGKGETTYIYDLNDNILSKTVNGNTIIYEYDLNNRLLNTYYSNNRVISSIYDSKGQVIEVHDGLIDDYRVYKYEYDPNGNLITYTNPLNSSLTKTYDKDNRLLSESDYLGNITTYTYDNFNNPLTITDFNGNTTTYEYDYYSKPTKILDPLGNVTLNEYDVMSNLYYNTDPTGRTSKYEYDKFGNITKQIYNSATSPIEIEDQKEVIYTYDQYSNLLYINNGHDGEVNEYDDFGRLSKIIYPNGSITTNEYDYNSNLIKTTSSLNGTREANQYTYDDYGRLSEAINGNGKTTYKYDVNNQLIEANESGSITKYEYDIYNNVSKLTYPDSSFVTYEYDEVNNVTSLSDKLGLSSFEYDDNSRLVEQKTSTTKSLYSYDNNGNKLTAVNTNSKDSLISSYSYEYNGLNNVTKEILEDKKGISLKEYSYNESNEIQELKETDNNNLITITNYEFDIYGNKSKEIITSPNGTVTTNSFDYNRENQLISKSVNSKITEKYKYDDNGNLISKETKEGNYTYSYSPSNKLLDAYLDGKLETRYMYNTNGLKSHELVRKEYPYDYEVDDSYYQNIKTFLSELEESESNVKHLVLDDEEESNGTEIFNTIAALGTSAVCIILLACATPFAAFIGLCIGVILIGGVNLANFLLHKNDSPSYSWVSDAVAFNNAIYEPKFIRKLKSLFYTEDDIQVIFEPGKYTYDYTYENPLILSEGYNSTSYKSNYVYLNNRLLEDTKQSKSYLYDGKYSISEVITKTTLSLRYDIYGNILTSLTQEDKTVGYNTLQYTPQNNLTYIRARYYDSSTGTFITKDTYLGDIYKPNTTNRYAYCSGDPVNNMDLDGHRFDDKGHEFDFVKPSYSKPTKPANKSSSGGKKPSNTLSGNNIVITYSDSGGHEHVYVPDPRQYYIIQYYLKKENTVSSAVDKIKKEIFERDSISIKQILTFRVDDKGNPGNIFALDVAASQKISKSTQEYITNNLSNIMFRNNLGEIYCDAYVNSSDIGNIATYLVDPLEYEIEQKQKWWDSNCGEVCINTAFDGFKVGTEYKSGTYIYENAWNLGKHKSTQCAVWVSMMSKYINGVSVGGNGIDQAKNARLITDNNGEPMFDYYEYTSGSSIEDILEFKPGTIISLGYSQNLIDNPNVEYATQYGHVLIEMQINDDIYLTEGNYDGAGSIVVRGAKELNDRYLKHLGDTYSYIGISVPRR